MFHDEFIATSNAAKAKLQLLNKNPMGYFMEHR